MSTPIKEITFDIKSLNQLDLISQFLDQKGETLVKIKLSDQNNDLNFKLQNKRNLDRKTINLLRNKDISAIIN